MSIFNAEHEQLDKKSVQPGKLIRINAVIGLTGLSKSYIYALSNKGLFPKNIHLVPGGTSVAWLESEILTWIESRVKARDQEAA